jgi:sensor histidine kinase regulating citrate/malate metabolism
MIKNALEAESGKSQVVLKCQQNGVGDRFSVHNQTFIPRDIQLQLFKRSFTTKGVGRGIGTYSMKLLGEKYLNGKVGFESTPEEGTTFFIDL